jgi:hypothetical protein
MTYRGHVKNGVIVPEAGADLPEGAEVRIDVTVSENAPGPAQPHDEDATTEIPSFYERYKSVIGVIKDLPQDFAANHDHYIHGQPKRQ